MPNLAVFRQELCRVDAQPELKTMAMRVGVTGAGGFIGGALCNAFVNAGWDVVAYARGNAPTVAGMEWRRFDLGQGIDPEDLSGIDVLVHAAYDTRERDTVNVDGTRRLFEAARACGVHTRVFVSSMAAASHSASQYGRTKYACESYLDASRDLIVRPGLVIGDGGLFRSMYRALTRYRFAPIFGSGKQPVYTVGVDDLCAAITALIRDAAHGAFTIANPEPVEIRTLYGAIARRVRGPVLFVPMPLNALLAGVTFFERLGVQLPLDSERLRGIENLRRMPDVAEEIHGVRPRPTLPVVEAVQIS
jgi:nucleoside-diphosphate-sugar epimerase